MTNSDICLCSIIIWLAFDIIYKNAYTFIKAITDFEIIQSFWSFLKTLLMFKTKYFYSSDFSFSFYRVLKNIHLH